jgi:hypothetical protein
MATASFPRCSVYARTESHESPLGSTVGFTRNFLLEIPLPWTKSAIDSAQVSQEIKAAIASYRKNIGEVSVTLLVPDYAYAGEGARLIDVQVTDGHITKRDLIARDGDIAAIICAIADDKPLPETVHIDDSPIRDIIVCTHGSRDACCGTFGVPIYQHLRQLANTGGATRVWRSSHLGGHRFAPTLVDFPSGRCWAFVDETVAESILTRSESPELLKDHYRGWVGHKDAALQMLEGEALARFGWQWTRYAQRGTVVSRDGEGRGREVEIIATHPHLPEITVRGEIEWGEEFTTIASCNAAPVTYMRKSLTQFASAIHETACSD